MKRFIFLITAIYIFSMNSELLSQEKPSYNILSKEEAQVILKKGTEYPFTGKFEKFTGKGTYICKQCGAALFYSDSKFDASCGWPSFDDEIKDAVSRHPDIDGQRTEIVCANCGAHLGHVFYGEGFTDKNTRHCVNSISMNFIPGELAIKTDTAIFAGGCFWGLEDLIKKQTGVMNTTVGYTSGMVENPTYKNHEGHARFSRD